jgi:hypothetical protein
MKTIFLAYVALVGVLAFVILFFADRQMNEGIERLSNYRIPPHSALGADSEIKLVGSKRSEPRNMRTVPSMRTRVQL